MATQKTTAQDDGARIPNVFEEIRQVFGIGEENHLGAKELTFNALGFGLVLLCAFATALDNTSALPFETRTVLSWTFLGSFALFLIACAYAPRSFYEMFHNHRIGIAACAVNTAALLATMAIPALGTVGGAALACLAGVALGVSLGMVAIFWARIFTRMYIPDAAACALVATAGALIVFLLVLNTLPLPIEHVVAALCPLGSAFFMRERLMESPAWPDLSRLRTYREMGHVWPLFIYKVALPLFCVGVAMNLFVTYAHRTLATQLDVMHMAGLVIIVAAAGIIAWFAIYGIRTSVQSFTRFLSVVIPLITLCSAPLAPMPSEGLPVVNLNLFASVCLLAALSWTFLASASLEYSYASPSTFGLGMGAFALGLAAGQPIMTWIPNDNPSFAVLIGVLCFFMTFGFFNRPAPNLAHSTYNQKAAERASAVLAANAREERESLGTGDGAGIAGGQAAPTNGVGEKPSGPGTVTYAGGWAGAGAAGMGACATGETGAASAGAIRDASAGGEASGGAWVHGSGAVGEQPGGAGATGSGAATGNGVATGDSRQKGRFIRRCERVAAMYLLSSRETEVLVQLAKGRSMNYIKDALVISEGTAKTHISHVYKKLDVHSRHELIELIESIEAE